MTKTPPAPLELTYYSDVLCIFAYASEVKIRALKEAHGDALKVVRRACDSFGNTDRKIGDGWKDKGGWEGYADHVSEIASRFDHITLHSDVWRGATGEFPQSAPAAEGARDRRNNARPSGKGRVGAARAFFAEAADIDRWELQRDMLVTAGVAAEPAEESIRDGRAFAAWPPTMEVQRSRRSGAVLPPTTQPRRRLPHPRRQRQ